MGLFGRLTFKMFLNEIPKMCCMLYVDREHSNKNSILYRLY